MKKIIIFGVALVIVLGAALAYAVTKTVTTPYTLSDPNGSATNIVIRPSTNVTLQLNSGTSCYAVGTAHLTGDRQFGASCDSTAIFWASHVIGTSTPDKMGTTTGSDAFGTGWATL